ncbi:hypothetical protein BJ742DRAFT_843051 [Cladochytrium replicatum]|nr:hypothetical protein BJ742DRAFT_843051 [Cladochytrium replicatum]
MRANAFSTLVVLLFFIVTQVFAARYSRLTGWSLTGGQCNAAHSVCAAACMARCRRDPGSCAVDCPDRCDCAAFACMCQATGDPYYCDELAC